MAKYNEHSFYCMRCGRKGIALPRKNSHQYGRYHRKRLWCPWCKMEVNHIECKNDTDVFEFKKAFEAGEYRTEVEESLKYINNEINLLWS